MGMCKRTRIALWCALAVAAAVAVVAGAWWLGKRSSRGCSREALMVHSKRCGYCVRMLPVWKGLGSRVGSTRLLESSSGDMARRLGVTAYPTIVFTDKGTRKEIARHVGAITNPEELKRMILSKSS